VVFQIDVGAQRFGGAFHLFGAYFHARQLVRQCAALGKAR
jgi:hypothetical protein